MALEAVYDTKEYTWKELKNDYLLDEELIHFAKVKVYILAIGQITE